MNSFFAAIVSSAAFPILVPWAWWQERRILRLGSPLSPEDARFAICLGILEPGKVRILGVRRVPMPAPRILVDWFHNIFPSFPSPAGMTLGHGIYAVQGYQTNQALIRHELVHVQQHENCGGHAKFLWLYMHQCLTVGYDQAPMEMEARERSLGDI